VGADRDRDHRRGVGRLQVWAFFALRRGVSRGSERDRPTGRCRLRCARGDLCPGRFGGDFDLGDPAPSVLKDAQRPGLAPGLFANGFGRLGAARFGAGDRTGRVPVGDATATRPGAPSERGTLGSGSLESGSRRVVSPAGWVEISRPLGRVPRSV
jgi:hypothetical protein